MKSFFTTLLIATLTAAAIAQENCDLIVRDKILVQRCVLDGIGSSRVVAVGQPGGLNYAFDAVNCLPVAIWTGGFLDFSGEANGRGGNGCKPLGVLQPLGTDEAPLRIGNAKTLPDSIRFRGYERESSTGTPTFLFEVDGVAVEQQIASHSPGTITVDLTFPGHGEAKRFYRIDPTPHLNIVLADGLGWSAPGVIEIPAKLTKAKFVIHLKATDKRFVRNVEKLSGEEIYRNYCSACHSLDGSKLIGPTFKDILGREVTVSRDGQNQTITTNSDYLRESILKPQAAIVKDYEAVPMADFSSVLTEQQIDGLIAYLQDSQHQ